MAVTNITVPAGATRAYEVAIAAGEETRVKFTTHTHGARIVVNSADKPIYFTINGSAPAPKDANCDVIFVDDKVAVVSNPHDRSYLNDPAAPLDIRLICETAAVVSIV